MVILVCGKQIKEGEINFAGCLSSHHFLQPQYIFAWYINGYLM